MNILALTGVLPGLVAMWYVDRLDAKRPEPPKLRRLVALLGGLSVIPAIVLGTVLQKTVGESIGPEYTYEGAFYHAFLLAAFIEELCKIGVVYWVVWRLPDFDERMDGIVYATRAGLGFAIVENVFYLAGQQQLGSFITTFILRALLAVPGHAMWTGMIGAFAARRRFDGKGIGLLGGFLLAVLFHGAYDVCIFAGVPLTIEGKQHLAYALLAGPVLLTIAAAMLMRRLSKTAAHLDDQDALNRPPAPAGPPWPGMPHGHVMPGHPPPYGGVPRAQPPYAYPYPYPYPAAGGAPPPWPAAPAPPSPYAPPGAPPSPYAPPGPSPYAPGAPPSPYAPPGPSPYAPPGALPSPYAPPSAQPSPYAPPSAQPSPYAPGAPPSPYAPPGAPPSPYAPPSAQPSPYAPPGAPPSPYAPPSAQPSRYEPRAPAPFVASPAPPAPYAPSTAQPSPFAPPSAQPSPFAPSAPPLPSAPPGPPPAAPAAAHPSPFARPPDPEKKGDPT